MTSEPTLPADAEAGEVQANDPHDPHAQDDHEGAPKKKRSIPEKIRDLVVHRAEALIWDGDHAYAVITVDGHVRTLPVGSRAFRRWVTVAGRDVGIQVPSHQAFKDAEGSLAGVAEEATGVQPTPSIRVAARRDSHTIYIDLGDDKWNCVKVTAEGWEVVPHPADGPYMYRPPRMAALPVPKRGGTVDDLWQFISAISEDERLLLLANILASLWPRGPYPILVVYGVQGGTKTTTLEVIKSLTDPSRPSPDKHALTSLRRPPRDPRDLVAAAKGARVVAYDNVSYLDEWLSDAICSLSTGADMGGRELFSDFDEAIVNAIRPVMINGIPEIVGKQDLTDRAIKIEAHPPERRMAESEFWQSFEEQRPKIFGAVLDLLSATLASWPEARVPDDKDVRMADFARMGEAMQLARGGKPGEFTSIFHANRTNAAQEIADMDSVTAALRNMVNQRGEQRTGQGMVWVGTVGELLGDLKEGELFTGRGWWSSPQALRAHLDRSIASLRAVGITIHKSKRRILSPRRNKGTIYTITVRPEDDR